MLVLVLVLMLVVVLVVVHGDAPLSRLAVPEHEGMCTWQTWHPAVYCMCRVSANGRPAASAHTARCVSCVYAYSNQAGVQASVFAHLNHDGKEQENCEALWVLSLTHIACKAFRCVSAYNITAITNSQDMLL